MTLHSAVQGSIKGYSSIGFAGDNRCPAAFYDDASNMVAVITTVGQEDFGVGKVSVDQRIKAFEVRDFPAGYFRPDRQTVSVGNEVDLGREATF